MRLVALLLIVTFAWPAAVGAGASPRLVVVVHPTRTDRLSMADVGRIYLRARRFWQDGTPIAPVNLEADSPERIAFTEHVLGWSPGRLTAYWNERYFQGVFPPTVVSSAAAVKRWVSTDPGAVGYLDAREVDDTVRVALSIGE